MPLASSPHPIALVRRQAHASGRSSYLTKGCLEVARDVLPYSRRAARLLERVGLERPSHTLSAFLAELSSTGHKGVPAILVDKLADALGEMLSGRAPKPFVKPAGPLGRVLDALEKLRLETVSIDEVEAKPVVARVSLDENPAAFFYAEGRGLDAVPSGLAVMLADVGKAPLRFVPVRGPMLDVSSRLYAIERMKDIVLEPIHDEGARLLSLLTQGTVARVAILHGGGVRITLRDDAIAYAVGLEDADRDRANGAGRFLVLNANRAKEIVAALAARDDVTLAWASAEKWRTARASVDKLRVHLGEKRDWLGLDVDGAVLLDGLDDGEQLAIGEVLRALREGKRYVMKGDALVAITDALADALDPLAAAPSAPALLSLADAGVPLDRSWLDDLDKARVVDGEPPKNLNATLRAYQKDGLRFLRRLALWKTGAVLADDMGLGKTVQAIALLLDRSALGPALVVAPTSVCFNWADELAKFAPSLRVLRYEGPKRRASVHRVTHDDDRPPSATVDADVVVVSYAILQRDADVLREVHWSTLILDEAQQVKNASTRRAKAVRALRADARIALTGTPLENHTGELWAIFHAVSPGLFGSWTEFKARFASPIEKDADVRRRKTLARAIAPFVLRRKKRDVAPELPPRTEVNQHLPLEASERRAYDRIRSALLVDILRPGAEDNSDRALPASEKRVKILAAITKLRLVACHASFADDVALPPEQVAPGTKQRALVDLLLELKDAGHHALVFSQFVRHLEIARAAATAAGITSLQLDGSTPAKDRQDLVARFQSGEVDAFFLSTKAGGFGLNLVRASYVVHLDPWWNPAVEDQAADRAHRIGQTDPVTVVRLIAEDTLEEEMLDLQAHKRALVEGVLEGTAAAGSLSIDELIAIVARTRRRADDEAQELSVDPAFRER